MVRQGIQPSILAKVGKELEVVEKCKTNRRGKGKTNCSP